MASLRDHLSVQRRNRAAKTRDKEQRPQSIQKAEPQPVRRSVRIAQIHTGSERTELHQKDSFVSIEKSQKHSPLVQSQRRKLKTEDAVNPPTTERPPKRIRSQPASPRKQTICQYTATGINASQRSHITYWAAEQEWPKEFFQDDRMNPLLAKMKLPAPLRRERSEASLVASTTTGCSKSAPYRNSNYALILQNEAGSYMAKFKLGITKESAELCQSLLDSKQIIPTDTIFRDDIFEDNCQRLLDRNEARIFKDCTPLLVPGAEAHATISSKHDLDILIESVNEGWNNSIPITNPRPQPDYAVGFRQSAFSDDQLKKLEPFLGNPATSSSFFMGTYYMYFPFLTCEVKCVSAGLNIADRQNLHSMTLAVRGIVELFRMAKCVEKLHREVLAFSVSHDPETVKIYGHFPVIEGEKTTYWRHPLRIYSFTDQNGRDKWTAYTFTKNLYDIWVPMLFEKLSSAIDRLPPEKEFEAPDQPEPQTSEASGLSQQLQDQSLSKLPESQPSNVNLHQTTPDTSARSEEPASKKKKT